MSDSDDSTTAEWILYKDRPEWKDITPVPQDDGDEPVVAIAYSEKFKDIYDYLRGIMKVGEKSERALRLTADAAGLNPANYTVWQFRRDILQALDSDLHEELKYIENIIIKHQKNYQVWHHRRVLIEWLKDASQELHITEKILSLDAKNYHAWQHRQWAMKTFKLFENELDYTENLLKDDIRNNSAWNQRYFVINNTTGFTQDIVEREIQFTLAHIQEVKENESAWNYLRGLLLHDKNGLSNNETVKEFCETLYSHDCKSPFLLALIVDMCDEQITSGGGDSRYSLERALDLCHELGSEYDQIRCKYWKYMATTLERKATQHSDEAAAGELFDV